MGARDLPHENVNGRGSFRADRSSCVYAPTDKKIKLAVRVGASTVRCSQYEYVTSVDLRLIAMHAYCN